MIKECTMILCTCDAYEDTWIPFFACLEKYWPDFDMPVVINTESKSFKYKKFNIKTFNLFQDRKVPWGERLIEHLKRIETKYVLFMLDDFFLARQVNVETISDCITWMEENDNIAVFSFHRVDDEKNLSSDKYVDFELRPRNGQYRFNCQAAVWRRERLIEFVKKNESPWDWEIFGSIRSRKFNDEFYSLIDGVEEPLFYNMYANGTGICRGKWVKNVVVPLFDELELNIDYSIRGFSNDDETTVDRRTLIQKCMTKLKKLRAYIQSLL